MPSDGLRWRSQRFLGSPHAVRRGLQAGGLERPGVARSVPFAGAGGQAAPACAAGGCARLHCRVGDVWHTREGCGLPGRPGHDSLVVSQHGVAIFVRRTFLARFAAAPPRWGDIVPGAMDLVAVYLPTGLPFRLRPDEGDGEAALRASVQAERREAHLALADASPPTRGPHRGCGGLQLHPKPGRQGAVVGGSACRREGDATS